MSEKQKPHDARFWEQSEKDTIKCNLCPRHCVLSDGQNGFCFVRKNVSGKMILTTYGRSSGFCIDPIEKKPLNHFYPGSKILSFGTAGCNLGCKFCQNWDLSRSREFDKLTEKASPEEIALAAKTHDCKSVAFTYNDPIIFAEYAYDTAIACHKLDIKTVAVTAGYITDEARASFFEHIDATNVDLKSFSEDFYEKYCSGQLEPVLKTLIYLKEKTDIWFEITNLIIPGLNDKYQELTDMTKWISDNLGNDVPLHFSAFHPTYKMTDRKATPIETLIRAREIALNSGLKYVYTGNVHHKEGASTYCSKCDHLLIERDWYRIGEDNLINNNQCPKCTTVCAGIF
ncbi:MAG: AmmeMemoRadiSam system radical SAM enzyme [Candidatus Omnitrophica bacterium]|nr:AmmeMemoRadiSam system radical SAM enzyme [Candidatus Omnitrophota bacterium]